MSTPHCYICGRWDGTHSGGCSRTGFDYRAGGPTKIMPHDYHDPYRYGTCLTCGSKKSDRPTKTCR